MPNGTDTPPNTTDGNPFSLIAYVLFRVRNALEDMEDGSRPPRWVRIGRAARYRSDALGGILSGAVDVMAETFSFLAEVTLDLEELLYQADALAALGQVALRFFRAVGEPAFSQGINTLLGTAAEDINQVLSQVGNTASAVDRYLGLVPSPEDVRGIGHELYRLLCIVQPPFPRNPLSNQIDLGNNDLVDPDQQVRVMEAGKVRLLAWAYDHGIHARGLGPGEMGRRELFRFGVRRLYMTGALPASARLRWSSEVDPLYEISFSNPTSAVDVTELFDLLRIHGYLPTAPASIDRAVQLALMRFQAINQIPVTGEVDNDTINRLINLDYQGKNLRRARPNDPSRVFPWEMGTMQRAVAGELTLVNPGADRWEDEGLSLVLPTTAGRYPYYLAAIASDPPPSGSSRRGWLNEPVSSTSAVGSFVALHSRASNRLVSETQSTQAQMGLGRFDGDIWTEGDSAHGIYFWAARHVEPWRAGRTGEPGSGALFNGAPVTAGTISRMYQWIPLPGWLYPVGSSTTPDGTGNWDLYVSASVLQRSLFRDRANAAQIPDQGRIALEVYGNDVFTAQTASLRSGAALERSETEFFPNAAFAAAANLPPVTDVDRARLWVLRRTDPVLVPATGAAALCLVAEGYHRSAYDTDAYFDDFRVTYEWRRRP